MLTVTELLKSVVAGQVTEKQFMEDYSRLFRGDQPMSPAESQCLSELVEDVNMAEHVGPLFDNRFIWRLEECLRHLEAGSSASEIKNFFRVNR